MEITTITSFSRFLKHVDPQTHFSGFNEPLPIYQWRTEAFEYFCFDGWDLDNTLDLRNRSYSFDLPTDEQKRPDPQDHEAYHEFMKRRIGEMKVWQRIVATDFDAVLEYGLKLLEPLELAKTESYNKFLADYGDFPFLGNRKPVISHAYYDDRKDLSTFSLFAEWLDVYLENDDLEELSISLPSGRTARVVTLTSAMALLAMDKATGSALKNETWATSVLLVDASTLLSEAKRMFEYEYEYELEEKKTKNRLKKRHEKTHAIKEFAINKANQFQNTSYSKLKIAKLIFPEVEA